MKRLISFLLIACQIALGVMIPHMQAQAAAGELAWAHPSREASPKRHTANGLYVPMWDPEWTTLASMKLRSQVDTIYAW